MNVVLILASEMTKYTIVDLIQELELRFKEINNVFPFFSDFYVLNSFNYHLEFIRDIYHDLANFKTIFYFLDFIQSKERDSLSLNKVIFDYYYELFNDLEKALIILRTNDQQEKKVYQQELFGRPSRSVLKYSYYFIHKIKEITSSYSSSLVKEIFEFPKKDYIKKVMRNSQENILNKKGQLNYISLDFFNSKLNITKYSFTKKEIPEFNTDDYLNILSNDRIYRYLRYLNASKNMIYGLFKYNVPKKDINKALDLFFLLNQSKILNMVSDNFRNIDSIIDNIIENCIKTSNIELLQFFLDVSYKTLAIHFYFNGFTKDQTKSLLISHDLSLKKAENISELVHSDLGQQAYLDLLHFFELLNYSQRTSDKKAFFIDVFQGNFDLNDYINIKKIKNQIIKSDKHTKDKFLYLPSFLN